MSDMRMHTRRLLIVMGCVFSMAMSFGDSHLWDSISSAAHASEKITTQNSSTGSASDLGDLPAVGWPLGVPMTCKAMTDDLAQSLRAATEKIREYCNEQNEKMKSAGYKTCGVNECLDSAITRDNGYDHGKFTLRLFRSIYTGEPVVTLTYSYPGNIAPNGTFPVCFDPVTRAESILSDEFAMWDFGRFIEFCAERSSSAPQK